MAEIGTTLDIERPLEAVWRYLTDFRRTRDWSDEVIDSVYTGPLGLGATGVDTRRLNRREWKVNWEVTGYRPPTFVALTFGPPLNASTRFTFRPTPTGGTRVTCTTTTRPSGWMRVLDLFLVAEKRRADEKRLARAKWILENRQVHWSAGGSGGVLADHSG